MEERRNEESKSASLNAKIRENIPSYNESVAEAGKGKEETSTREKNSEMQEISPKKDFQKKIEESCGATKANSPSKNTPWSLQPTSPQKSLLEIQKAEKKQSTSKSSSPKSIPAALQPNGNTTSRKSPPKSSHTSQSVSPIKSFSSSLSFSISDVLPMEKKKGRKANKKKEEPKLSQSLPKNEVKNPWANKMKEAPQVSIQVIQKEEKAQNQKKNESAKKVISLKEIQRMEEYERSLRLRFGDQLEETKLYFG